MLNEVRLTRAEYWLLESAVDTIYPLAALVAPDLEEMIFNKPGPGVGRDALAATLARLFRDGLLEAFVRTHTTGSWSDGPAGPLEADGLAAALDEPGFVTGDPASRPIPPLTASRRRTHYRLTSQGGLVWESFARPQWDRFVLDESDRDGGRFVLTCAKKARLRRYHEALVAYESLYGAEMLTPVRYSEVGPWEPTYWKRLPGGHRAEFVMRVASDDEKLDQFSTQARLVFAGFCELRDSWYRWR